MAYTARMLKSTVFVIPTSEILGFCFALWLFAGSVPLFGQVLCPLLTPVVPLALISLLMRVIASLRPCSQEAAA